MFWGFGHNLGETWWGGLGQSHVMGVMAMVQLVASWREERWWEELSRALGSLSGNLEG